MDLLTAERLHAEAIARYIELRDRKHAETRPWFRRRLERLTRRAEQRMQRRQRIHTDAYWAA